jgi:hypothetical protein
MCGSFLFPAADFYGRSQDCPADLPRRRSFSARGFPVLAPATRRARQLRLAAVSDQRTVVNAQTAAS